MTASKEAIKAGLNSLTEASLIANKPRRTLERNYHTNRKYFNVIIAGCVAVKGRELDG